MKIFIWALLVFGVELSCSLKIEQKGYVCRNDKCIKYDKNESEEANLYSFYECRVLCGNEIGTIWPKPLDAVIKDRTTVPFDISTVSLNTPKLKEWTGVKERFLKQISNKVPKSKDLEANGFTLNISINHPSMDSNDLKLTLDTDESYKLEVTTSDKNIFAKIDALTFFGARHGLETLMQLIFYDDLNEQLRVVSQVRINDKPKYKWRGVTLDTSRNFIAVPTIKKMIDGMAMSKLNTFHWHITDSQSFPFEMLSLPELHINGAYEPNKIYRQQEIKEIIQYALERGIRVLPEFDAPAHVGEGWQNLDVLVCFKNQPWQKYCVEPPCGQLDPTAPEVYDILEKIYSDLTNVFKSAEFHMGGDEVSVECWNSSSKIQNWMRNQGWGLEEKDFMKLWNRFQTEALKRLEAVTKTTDTPIILWTSRLTERPYVDQYLDPNRYIIQVWTTKDDPKIKYLHDRGFRTIISNYDALYLDCGGPGWVTGGQNWCSPYKGWQDVYSNSLERIGGKSNNLVLGAEGAIWSEQIDDYTLLPRLFPRLSALAENLWSSSDSNWKKAESRMLLHRQLLVENDIPSESLQPQWCLQNENECPIDAY